MPTSAGPPRADRSLATGTQDVLSLTTPITGKLNVTGSLTSKATGAVGDAIGGLLGADAAKRIGSVNIKAINASAEIRGNVVITMRPRIAQTWHVEPNFGAQVILGDTSLVLAGAQVNVPDASQACDRQDRRRAAQCGQRAHPQRQVAGAHGAGAMGQGLPLNAAARHRRDRVAAAALARAQADPRRCRAADRQRHRGGRRRRHRGREPDHADRNQAELSVPRQDLDRATDRGGHRHRRADRPALHRARQDPQRAAVPDVRFPRMAPARSTSPSRRPLFQRPATGC